MEVPVCVRLVQVRVLQMHGRECRPATRGDKMMHDVMIEHQSGDGYRMNSGYNLDQAYDGNKLVRAL